MITTSDVFLNAVMDVFWPVSRIEGDPQVTT